MTEFAENQLIPNEVKVIQHVFVKILNIFRIIVVGIVSYDNVWVLNNVFKKHSRAILARGEFNIWINHILFFLLFTRSGLVDIKHVDKEDCFLIVLGDQSRRVDHAAYRSFPLPDGILYYFLR